MARRQDAEKRISALEKPQLFVGRGLALACLEIERFGATI
jgi:hypothetical protein